MNKREIAEEIAEVRGFLIENENILEKLNEIDVDQVEEFRIIWGERKRTQYGVVSEVSGMKEIKVKTIDNECAKSIVTYLIALAFDRVENAYIKLDELAEQFKNAPR